MTMRERFSDDEWRLVMHIPFDAFIFGAQADGKIEEAEMKAFADTLDRAPALKDPLHREIALDYATAGLERVGEELTFELSESGTAMKQRWAKTKPMLQEKLTRAEYQSFFKSVWLSAMAIAGATTTETKKKGIFSKKKESKPINEKEAQALAAFAIAWDVDMSFLGAHAS